LSVVALVLWEPVLVLVLELSVPVAVLEARLEGVVEVEVPRPMGRPLACQ